VTGSRKAVEAFAAADVVALDGLDGLRRGLALADLPFAVDPEAAGRGVLGAGARHAWVVGESLVYEGGVRVWLDDDGAVLLLEGEDPVDGAGEPLLLPDLGEPEMLLEAVLDRLVLDGGERAYPSRGLVVRVNPANAVVLGVLVFAPTSPEDYLARLRPRQEVRRLLAGAPGAGRSGVWGSGAWGSGAWGSGGHR
jgi:hypothetical protein